MSTTRTIKRRARLVEGSGTHPQLSPNITVSGHVYDLDTGLVTTILERRHPSSAIPEHRTHTNQHLR
jgi:hypothetical protein